MTNKYHIQRNGLKEGGWEYGNICTVHTAVMHANKKQSDLEALIYTNSRV